MFWRQHPEATRGTTETGQARWSQPDITIAKSKLFAFYNISWRKETKSRKQRTGIPHQDCPQITAITRMVDKTSNIPNSCRINIQPQACFSRWQMLSHHQEGRRKPTLWCKFIVLLLSLSSLFRSQELSCISHRQPSQIKDQLSSKNDFDAPQIDIWIFWHRSKRMVSMSILYIWFGSKVGKKSNRWEDVLHWLFKLNQHRQPALAMIWGKYFLRSNESAKVLKK